MSDPRPDPDPTAGPSSGRPEPAADSGATDGGATGDAAAEASAADADPPGAGSPSGDTLATEEQRFEQALRLAEALVFSSATPVGGAALSRILPDGCDPDAVITTLRTRYAGRGVELVEAGGGVQFRTAVDLAPQLRRVIEAPRRLPRVAMETLAIVAYHQPVTRPEIEDIRGASLSQQTLDALLEASLITPMGRRDSPGRPTLWGTTPQFLTQFGLKDIRDLPRRDDLLVELPQPAGRAGSQQAGLQQAGSQQDSVGSGAADAAGPATADDAGSGTEQVAATDMAIAAGRPASETGDSASRTNDRAASINRAASPDDRAGSSDDRPASSSGGAGGSPA